MRENQAERLHDFEFDHPEISVTAPVPGGRVWSARRAGEVLCAEYSLASLLERLEWLLKGEQ